MLCYKPLLSFNLKLNKHFLDTNKISMGSIAIAMQNRMLWSMGFCRLVVGQ